MRIQISSGQGPEECEFEVRLLYERLEKEIENLRVIRCAEGKRKEGFSSIICEPGDENWVCPADIVGTVLWICRSPYRPEHKRKNWYVNVSILGQVVKQADNDHNQIRFETFRCGGKGGQNVNKVESGVRAIHIPTGIAAVSTEERSQYRNKELAVKRLWSILEEKELNCKKMEIKSAWEEHSKLVRGNPVRIYEGEHFKRKK